MIFFTPMKKPQDYIALALDNCTDRNELARLVRATHESVGVFKIGLEQFIRFGPPILEVVRETQAKVFLDLKLHDIPNTVAKAVSAAAEHKVAYLTIHTSGGGAMLAAAAEAAARTEAPPVLLGVSVLTSIDQKTLNEDLAVPGDTSEHVRHLASLAVSRGLKGIVCSAADLKKVKPAVPADFVVVTPGIRLLESTRDDQKRIATPETAITNGATLLVIGRPITQAPDPAFAARKILDVVEATLGAR